MKRPSKPAIADAVVRTASDVLVSSVWLEIKRGIFTLRVSCGTAPPSRFSSLRAAHRPGGMAGLLACGSSFPSRPSRLPSDHGTAIGRAERELTAYSCGGSRGIGWPFLPGANRTAFPFHLRSRRTIAPSLRHARPVVNRMGGGNRTIRAAASRCRLLECKQDNERDQTDCEQRQNRKARRQAAIAARDSPARESHGCRSR